MDFSLVLLWRFHKWPAASWERLARFIIVHTGMGSFDSADHSLCEWLAALKMTVFSRCQFAQDDNAFNYADTFKMPMLSDDKAY